MRARPDTDSRSPDAEQAQHPPVDPGEMGFPDTACIAFRIAEQRCLHTIVEAQHRPAPQHRRRNESKERSR